MYVYLWATDALLNFTQTMVGNSGCVYYPQSQGQVERKIKLKKAAPVLFIRFPKIFGPSAPRH
jgi:hypothetical protein